MDNKNYVILLSRSDLCGVEKETRREIRFVHPRDKTQHVCHYIFLRKLGVCGKWTSVTTYFSSTKHGQTPHPHARAARRRQLRTRTTMTHSLHHISTSTT